MQTIARFAIGWACCLAMLFGTIGCQSTPDPEPSAPLDDLHVGNQYAKDGLLREAVLAYQKALDENPRSLAAHRNLGMVYVKTGDYKRAVIHLEKSIDRFGDNYEANFYLAEAYRALEKYGEAIYRYKKALRLKRNDPKVMKALAWSYYKIRYYSEALRMGAKLRKLTPDDNQVAIILARILLKIKQEKKALAVIRRAGALAKKADLAYLQSVEGDVLLQMGRHNEAQQIYRAALTDQPLLPGALLGLGRSMIETGSRPDLALEYIERAVRIRPRLTEGLYALGKAYEKTDRKKAIRFYKQFRRQAARDPEFISELAEVKEKIAKLEDSKSRGLR